MNLSDYGYAVGKSVRDACLAKSMYYYYGDDCGINDWLTPSDISEWTLNPAPDSFKASGVFEFFNYANSMDAYYDYKIRPVAFLKSSTTITDALGTKDDPFIAS